MVHVTWSEPLGWFDRYMVPGGWLSLIAGVVGMLKLTGYSGVQNRLRAAFTDRGVAISAEIVDRKSSTATTMH